MKTISGSIAPSAAARTGLVGTRPTMKPRSVGRSGSTPASGTCICARRAALASGAIVMRSKSGGPASAAKMAAPARSARKTVTVRAPSRPSDRTSAKLETLVTSSDTTRGTRTIRIALTQSVPSGSIEAAAASSADDRAAATAMPAASPRRRAASPAMAGDRAADRRRLRRVEEILPAGAAGRRSTGMGEFFWRSRMVSSRVWLPEARHPCSETSRGAKRTAKRASCPR